jgi:hypothetical protein
VDGVLENVAKRYGVGWVWVSLTLHNALPTVKSYS